MWGLGRGGGFFFHFHFQKAKSKKKIRLSPTTDQLKFLFLTLEGSLLSSSSFGFSTENREGWGRGDGSPAYFDKGYYMH